MTFRFIVLHLDSAYAHLGRDILVDCIVFELLAVFYPRPYHFDYIVTFYPYNDQPPYFFFLLHTHLDFSYVLHDLSHVRLPIRPYTKSVRSFMSEPAHDIWPQFGHFPFFWIDDFYYYRLLVQFSRFPVTKICLLLWRDCHSHHCCTDGHHGEAWLIYES